MAESRTKSASQSFPVYVIVGEDTSLLSAECERIIEKLLTPDERMTALFTADPRQISVTEVLDELRTLPFLAQKRVVIIRDADKFISDNRQQLEDYFDNPCPTAALILMVESWPSNTKLAKKLPGCGKLLAVTEPKGNQLQKRLIQYATEAHNKQLSRDAAQLIIELSGGQLGRLYTEIDKLAIFSQTQNEITLEHIESLIGRNRLFNAFEVIDSCLAGNSQQAVSRLREMFTADSSAEYKVVGAFAYHIRKMFRAKALLQKGKRIDEIAKQVNIWSNKHSFFEQIKKLTLEQIGSLLEHLARIDYEIKTGRTKANIAIEQLVLSLAGT